MKLDLSRHLPPGMDPRPHKRVFWCGLTVSALYSLLFFGGYSNARAALFYVDGPVYTLKPGAIMPDFVTLIDGPVFFPFFVTAAILLGCGAYHYAYHHQGGKSVYLMRRLPNKWERHRRCLTAPLASAAIVLLTAFVIMLLYFWYYMANTPGQCLTPNQWQKIWRAII